MTSKSFIKKILPLSLTLGILVYFCIKDNNFVTLINIFPKLNLVYLFLSVVIMFIYWVLDALIIKELSPSILNSNFDFFELSMYGQFYNSITPFSSGGQPAQVLFLNKKGISAGESISLLTKKLFISQLCTVVVSSLSILFKSYEFKQQIPGFIFLTVIGLFIQCFGIIAIVVFYINKKKVINLIDSILNFLHRMNIVHNPDKLENELERQLSFLMKNNFSINGRFMLFFYSFVQSICFGIVLFFVAKSFGLKGSPIFDIIATQSFMTLLSIANPLPGSAGTVEGSFLLLLRDFFDKHDISSAMILFRFINYYLGMVLGLFFVLYSKRNKKKLKI